MRHLPATVLCGVALLASSSVGMCAEATYVLHGRAHATDHTVNGFSQSVRSISDGVTSVRTSVADTPIGSEGAWTAVTSTTVLPGGSVFRLPSGLLGRLRSDQDAYTRATEVLRWVHDTLEVDTQDVGPQDALSVLRRGRGRCSGLANVVAGLLEGAGFKARTVSGLVVSDDEVLPHRWVECRLPGAGWVPTDPTLGYWVVTPRHIVFRGTVVDPPQIRIVEGGDERADLPTLDGMPVRPDRGAELIFRVVGSDSRPVVAVLRSESGDERRTLLEPVGKISGLFPGQWIFELEIGGRITQRQLLDLGPGSIHSMVVGLDDLVNP